jgi:hypothetical protein
MIYRLAVIICPCVLYSTFTLDAHTISLPQITNLHAYRSIRSNTLIVCNLEKRCFYCSLIIRYLVKQHSQKHTPRSGALRSSKQRLTREERSEEERNLSRKSSSRSSFRLVLVLQHPESLAVCQSKKLYLKLFRTHHSRLGSLQAVLSPYHAIISHSGVINQKEKVDAVILPGN